MLDPRDDVVAVEYINMEEESTSSTRDQPRPSGELGTHRAWREMLDFSANANCDVALRQIVTNSVVTCNLG